MGTPQNLVGKKYGRLTVIGLDSIASRGRRVWSLRCECGSFATSDTGQLNSGKVNSCGCIGSEKLKKRNTKHGMHGTRLYRIWRGMIARCSNENRNEYKNYGGRGISVCGEWLHEFTVFYNWSAANGYRDPLTIERINNDGDYCPDNCKWIPLGCQHKNRRKAPPRKRDRKGRFL